LLAAGISDQGKIRPNNEDRFLILGESPLMLLAVADGMGGHAAGEVASSMALDVIRSYLGSHRTQILQAAAQGQALLPFLEEMLALANATVLQSSGENSEYNGMGTTLTMILHVLDVSWLAHIGDSRIYRWDGKKLHQLTEDHSIVAELVRSGALSEREALVHPHRNVLTRSLGTAPQVFFDLKEENLDDGDILVLCTDGLYSLITEDELGNILTSYADPQQAAERLVELANERGGHDNITALVAAMGE